MRLRTAFPLLSLALLASASHATSWVKIPPHDPSRACPTIQAAVAQMVGKKPFDIWPLYYNDEFGHVEYQERAAFVSSMTTAHGQPDKTPLRITMVWPVGKRKTKDPKALYVVGIQRYRWFPERQGSFDPMQIEPAGYEIDTSYWLVRFSGQNILEMREGHSFFEFIRYDRRLKGCAG